MSDFLTEEELKGITGRKQKAAQRRWLQAEGFVYRVSAEGSPIVLREYFYNKLGLKRNTNTGRRVSSPDFSKVNIGE